MDEQTKAATPSRVISVQPDESTSPMDNPPPGYPPPGYQGQPRYQGQPGYQGQPPMFNGAPIVPQAYPGEGYPLPGHPPAGYPYPSIEDRLNFFNQGGISRYGLLSLIFGCLGVLFLPAIPGLIFGIKGLREGRVTHRGVGLSIGGIICSSVFLFTGILVGVILIAANA